jgi:hypothetical protein
VAAAVALLFAAFAAGIVINLARGNTAIGCGCFAFGIEAAARSDERLRGWHAARALGLAAAAALAVPALPGAPGVDGPWPERFGALLAGAVLALGAVAVAAVRAVGGGPRSLTGPAAAAVAHLATRRR